MRRESGLPGWMGGMEVFLVRLTATCLALTVAAQLLLANPSLRPLLNFAHRAEGVRIDPDLAGTISLDMPAAGRAGRAGGMASITLEAVRGGVAVPIQVEVEGKAAGVIPAGHGLPTRVTVEAAGGTEVALRLREEGEASRVVVAAVSPQVVYPARGDVFLVTIEGCRFRLKTR
ncbi:MAG: hypothetical protein ACM3X4_09560 [Ignavibacteriales bacterium]